MLTVYYFFTLVDLVFHSWEFPPEDLMYLDRNMVVQFGLPVVYMFNCHQFISFLWPTSPFPIPFPSLTKRLAPSFYHFFHFFRPSAVTHHSLHISSSIKKKFKPMNPSHHPITPSHSYTPSPPLPNPSNSKGPYFSIHLCITFPHFAQQLKKNPLSTCSILLSFLSHQPSYCSVPP